jgi:hypothetical protein
MCGDIDGSASEFDIVAFAGWNWNEKRDHPRTSKTMPSTLNGRIFLLSPRLNAPAGD